MSLPSDLRDLLARRMLDLFEGDSIEECCWLYSSQTLEPLPKFHLISTSVEEHFSHLHVSDSFPPCEDHGPQSLDL